MMEDPIKKWVKYLKRVSSSCTHNFAAASEWGRYTVTLNIKLHHFWLINSCWGSGWPSNYTPIFSTSQLRDGQKCRGWRNVLFLPIRPHSPCTSGLRGNGCLNIVSWSWRGCPAVLGAVTVMELSILGASRAGPAPGLESFPVSPLSPKLPEPTLQPVCVRRAGRGLEVRSVEDEARGVTKQLVTTEHARTLLRLRLWAPEVCCILSEHLTGTALIP